MHRVEGQYGESYWLKTHLVELIPKQGLELTGQQIEEIYDYLTHESRGYCALLINRINDYSLTFDAHKKLAVHTGLVAIAYLTYSTSSAQVAEYTSKLAHYARCPIKVFMDREAAIEWLEQRLQAYEHTKQTDNEIK